jgi:hypothetical protein
MAKANYPLRGIQRNRIGTIETLACFSFSFQRFSLIKNRYDLTFACGRFLKQFEKTDSFNLLFSS